MAKEENLKTNITAEKWFSLVYNYPAFDDYTVIRRSISQDNYNDYSVVAPAIPVDSLGNADTTAVVAALPPDYSTQLLFL